jgi:hypothetical protein
MTSLPTETREKAGWGKLGSQRYARYREAFDHADHCIEAGYHLQAIAVLDSLISDRLSSRLAFLTNKETSARLTCGQLCNQLLKVSTSSQDAPSQDATCFDEVVSEIQKWVHRRNAAIHGSAKILRRNDCNATFAGILESHMENATTGRALLRQFDKIDTKNRRAVGKSPATRPYAFFPERRKS